MGKFTFHETPIEGLYVVEPTVFADQRGYFMETYNDEFKAYVKHIDGTPCDYVQDNESRSCKGVLRGMHMQMTQKIIGVGGSAAVEIDSGFLCSGSPESENRLCGCPVCAQITAVVSILFFECVGRVEIVHSDRYSY